MNATNAVERVRVMAAPILVEDLRAVLRGDEGHEFAPVGVSRTAETAPTLTATRLGVAHSPPPSRAWARDAPAWALFRLPLLATERSTAASAPHSAESASLFTPSA